MDVTDEAGFGLVPPCADPSFDHRTCDYWEDAKIGARAARSAWLRVDAPPPPSAASMRAFNPFLDDDAVRRPSFNPFASDDAADNPFAAPVDNPFAPAPRRAAPVDPGAPRKLQLLSRGRGVFGSYAKVLLLDDEAAAYAQFGPLSAYPRALAVRDLYPALPASPLPAVITCIATTAAARGRGLGLRLVAAICDDLAGRGFAAVEAYPEAIADPDATSAATPAFWVRAGFTVAVDDARYPVMRRELG